MPRLIQLVFCSLAGMFVTAAAASGQDAATPSPASSLSTAPVTVITSRMIEDSGARNLKDVLVTFVPGMTFSQDHNEVNVAMRGVYASAQQKFLILVDGHVINSRSYATANPDFSITVDNVARIEVTRGPASSLHGGGALTAVVNIVTKSAASVDGAVAGIGAGSDGQVKLTGLFGGRTTGGDEVVGWATMYRSDGQNVAIPADANYSRVPGHATAIVDGFRGPVSHDVGLRLRTSAFDLFAAHRQSGYIEPFSSGGPTGESYDYDAYQPFQGQGPGLGIASFNIGVSHERAIGGSTLHLRGYADRMELKAHVVSDPAAGAHSLVNWKDWDAGASASLSRPYSTRAGDGRWMAGVQADYMRVYESVLSLGTGGGWNSTLPGGELLDLGNEHVVSTFAGVAHPLSARWSASAGVRYDRKDRHEGDDQHVVSPHAGVTYAHDARTSLAFLYARGFVDAPYWYRYNSLPSYQGSRDLQPEYLQSFQVVPSTTLDGGIVVRSAVFFNHLDDLVWRNKNAGPGDPTYQNAGFLRTWGVEPEVGWARDGLSLAGNLTFQRVLNAENYEVTGSHVNNVPSLAWNAMVTVAPAAAAAHDLRLNVTARFVGEQRSPVDIAIDEVAFLEPDRRIDRVLIVNAGLRAGTVFAGPWFVDARVFNVFDAGYEQGGSVSHPYPQAGRSTLLQVGRTF